MIPSGHFTGTVHGPFGKLIGKVWSGKVFSGSSVVNVIGGRERIRGEVTELHDGHGTVLIVYPQFGLADELWAAVPDGSIWNGRMHIWGRTVRFTLEKVKELIDGEKDRADKRHRS